MLPYCILIARTSRTHLTYQHPLKLTTVTAPQHSIIQNISKNACIDSQIYSISSDHMLHGMYVRRRRLRYYNPKPFLLSQSHNHLASNFRLQTPLSFKITLSPGTKSAKLSSNTASSPPSSIGMPIVTPLTGAAALIVTSFSSSEILMVTSGVLEKWMYLRGSGQET